MCLGMDGVSGAGDHFQSFAVDLVGMTCGIGGLSRALG